MDRKFFFLDIWQWTLVLGLGALVWLLPILTLAQNTMVVAPRQNSAVAGDISAQAPYQASWSKQPSGSCGQACHYDRASEVQQLQIAYLLKRAQLLSDLKSQAESQSDSSKWNELADNLGDFCTEDENSRLLLRSSNVDSDLIRPCYERWQRFNGSDVVSIRSSLLGNRAQATELRSDFDTVAAKNGSVFLNPKLSNQATAIQSRQDKTIYFVTPDLLEEGSTLMERRLSRLRDFIGPYALQITEQARLDALNQYLKTHQSRIQDWGNSNSNESGFRVLPTNPFGVFTPEALKTTSQGYAVVQDSVNGKVSTVFSKQDLTRLSQKLNQNRTQDEAKFRKAFTQMITRNFGAKNQAPTVLRSFDQMVGSGSLEQYRLARDHFVSEYRKTFGLSNRTLASQSSGAKPFIYPDESQNFKKNEKGDVQVPESIYLRLESERSNSNQGSGSGIDEEIKSVLDSIQR